MHIRFQRSEGFLEAHSGEVLTEQFVFGPFEFVQLTYGEVRVSPDGDPIAFIDSDSGAWHFVQSHPMVQAQTPEAGNDRDLGFSDVVIYE